MSPARAIAGRGAQALYRLGASRVWICGSIARSGRWDERSDVDFAVEGLPSHRLAEAHGLLTRLTARKVNVVPLEDAPAGLRAAIVACRILVDRDGRVHDGPQRLVPPVAASPSTSAMPAKAPWHERRLATVAATLIDAGARRIVDFGCGNGRLIELLAMAGAEWLTGVDRDADALRQAAARLTEATRARTTLRHGSLSAWHDTLAGHDAAVAVEVIEHLDLPDLDGFVEVAFGRLKPSVLVLTTPNAEFNTLLKSVDLRHPEHRFEWTRSQFRAWATRVAAAHGYTVSIRPLGRTYPGYGPVTQLAVFRLP
jgi:2-polyprenyl-3-methyl-5-hydroxy-6-metoxy-1,4-benzoquinol methylase/predicted nucleotidyltransferase